MVGIGEAVIVGEVVDVGGGSVGIAVGCVAVGETGSGDGVEVGSITTNGGKDIC